MKRFCVPVLLSISLGACSPSESQKPDEGVASGVIYGKDSRRDPQADPKMETPAIRHALQASATLMRTGYIRPLKNGSILIRGKDIKRERNLCPELRFLDQPTASYCSAVLIASNRVLTAGHCVETGCEDLNIVFGWTKYTAKILSRSDVYSCKNILKFKMSYEDIDSPDMAIVELDRVVADRKPVEISKEPLRRGDEVFIVGYPWGLPQKISTAKVRQETGENYVKVNSDTFTGDSGGPVFAIDGQLKGVLIGGEFDYVDDEKRSCKIVKHCKDNECRGEDVMRLNEATLR